MENVSIFMLAVIPHSCVLLSQFLTSFKPVIIVFSNKESVAGYSLNSNLECFVYNNETFRSITYNRGIPIHIYFIRKMDGVVSRKNIAKSFL